MSRLPRPAGAQRGMALLVVLVLLLLMTLLGLASLRGALMEERMTASLYDRSLSFQSAEAALREGEALALTRPTAPSSGCNAGVCSTPATAARTCAPSTRPRPARSWAARTARCARTPAPTSCARSAS